MKITSNGRVHRSAAEWRELFSRHAKSGLGVREFCLKEGIALESFRRWREKLNAEEPSAFVPVSIESPPESSAPSSWTVEIILPGGVRLRFQG